MKDSKSEAQLHNLSIPVLMIKRTAGEELISRVRSASSPVRCHLSAKMADDHEGCIICRDTFEIGSTVIRMPFCSHCFHEECGLQWLKSHNTCPVCRRELPTDDPEYEAERRREGRSHAGHVGENLQGADNNWETLLFG